MKQFIYITCALLGCSISFNTNAGNSIGVHCWEGVFTESPEEKTQYCFDIVMRGNGIFDLSGYYENSGSQEIRPISGNAVLDTTSNTYKFQWFGGAGEADISTGSLNGTLKIGAWSGPFTYLGVGPK
jgi:hypothetical protein